MGKVGMIVGLGVVVILVSGLIYGYVHNGLWIVGTSQGLGVTASETNVHKVLATLGMTKGWTIITWSKNVPDYQTLPIYQPFADNNPQPVWGCRNTRTWFGGKVRLIEAFIDTPLYKSAKGQEADYWLNAGMTKCLENQAGDGKLMEVINLLKQGSGNYMFSLTR